MQCCNRLEHLNCYYVVTLDIALQSLKVFKAFVYVSEINIAAQVCIFLILETLKT